MAPINRQLIQATTNDHSYVDTPQLIPWTEEDMQYLMEYSRIFLTRFATNLAILSIMISLVVLAMLIALSITRRVKKLIFGDGAPKPVATLVVPEKGPLRIEHPGGDDCPIHTGFCAVLQDANLERVPSPTASGRHEHATRGLNELEAGRAGSPDTAPSWQGNNQLNTSWAIMM